MRKEICSIVGDFINKFLLRCLFPAVKWFFLCFRWLLIRKLNKIAHNILQALQESKKMHHDDYWNYFYFPARRCICLVIRFIFNLLFLLFSSLLYENLFYWFMKRKTFQGPKKLDLFSQEIVQISTSQLITSFHVITLW